MAAYAHKRWSAIVPIARFLENAVDGARHVRNSRPATAGRETLLHRFLQQGVFLLQDRLRLANDRGAADLRELATIAGRDLRKENVAHVENPLARRTHGEVMLRSAHQQDRK